VLQILLAKQPRESVPWGGLSPTVEFFYETSTVNGLMLIKKSQCFAFTVTIKRVIIIRAFDYTSKSITSATNS
jgi:hypothetical protein